MNWVFVAIGGMLGAVLRTAIYQLYTQNQAINLFPYATLTVNLLGSFLMGCFAAFSHRYLWHDSPIAMFATFGVLGSFTTFSAFSYESLKLFKADQMNLAFLNIFMNVTGSLLLAYFGWQICQWALKSFG